MRLTSVFSDLRSPMGFMSKSTEALRSITTAATLSLTLFAGGFFQPAMAQTRSLPKANFNNYSGAGNNLPNAGGLSLQEGQDRPRGAPPEVYNPGEPSLQHKLVRWESRFMPLKVWISPGKKLSDKPISQINQTRPQEVLGLLKSDPGFSSLQQCAGWTPGMNSAAQVGIEQWKEFQNEGLFAFDFVDDPTMANILLFWSDGFTGDEGTGGVSTGGNTVAVLYDANEVRNREAASGGQPLQGTPVIIELRADESFDKLQGRAAHEFGHALGIKEHSPFNQDLMCVNGIVRQLSASDKATIRWLYHQRTPLLMLPPVIARGGGGGGYNASGGGGYSSSGGGGPIGGVYNASGGGVSNSASGGSTYRSPQNTGGAVQSGGGGWVDRAPGSQPTSTNSPAAGGDDYQSGSRPGGGYRIPTSRPVKQSDSYDDEVPSRPDSRADRPGATRDSGDRKAKDRSDKEREARDKEHEKELRDKDREKDREKKPKKRLEEPRVVTPTAPDYDAPKEKPSEGY